MGELRELLAEMEHKQWSELMEYWNIEHPLIGVPYSELPESKKESDRYFADKAISAFKAHIANYPKMTEKQLYDVCEKFRPYIVNFAEPKAVEEADRKALMESLK